MTKRFPEISYSPPTLRAVWGSVEASCDLREDAFPVAHLGCQHIRNNVKRVMEIPSILQERLCREYGERWKAPPDATKLVAEALETGARSCGLQGVTLIDTMRSGSDYWRPGKLLTDTAGLLRSRGLDVTYAREDALCPSPELLKRFRTEPAMSYASYSEAYSEQIQKKESLGVAAFLAVQSVARCLLPVYYCTDPYVPGYASLARQASTEGPGSSYYRERGCHRVPLLRCISDFLTSLSIKPVVWELDANSGKAYTGRFADAGGTPDV